MNSATKSLIKRTASILLILAIVGGGFICLMSADNSMGHAMDTATGNLGMHLAYANSLSQALTVSVTIALASLLVLALLFLTDIIGLDSSLPSINYFRQKWREPPGLVERYYSWLSLLVRSPGTINTA